jgi:hypothetical protein
MHHRGFDPQHTITAKLLAGLAGIGLIKSVHCATSLENKKAARFTAQGCAINRAA